VRFIAKVGVRICDCSDKAAIFLTKARCLALAALDSNGVSRVPWEEALQLCLPKTSWFRRTENIRGLATRHADTAATKLNSEFK
jgi:hypothetical protein